ncbi:head-tail connector protein [Pedomonas sp. V897]|uniref:head-tail connector protein n=1 Tax=Pedomonas sp. V897 TaxID=3446482 RepID=UPI003EE3A198
MTVAWLEGPAVEPVGIEEARAFLRLDGEEEDAALAAFLKAAREVCEAFTGLVLIATRFRETRAFDPAETRGVPWSAWRSVRLSRGPLRQVEAVTLIGRDGTRTALGSADYTVEEDARGLACLRMTFLPPAGARLETDYQAGLGAEPAGVPEALRLGILRLAAHLYSHRDSPDDAGPPLAVAALWRPFRIGRLA